MLEFKRKSRFFNDKFRRYNTGEPYVPCLKKTTYENIITLVNS